MQTRRATALPALNLILPHPSLPHPTLLSARTPTSHLGAGMASPRTPRSTHSTAASQIFFAAPNRKSTDSWGSSVDCDEDLHEWTQEQALLLSRTLDALPSHLLTPFAGPLPPANLLDKIARGVAHAKGDEWPHSVRATRAKLLELARASGERGRARNSITEEREGWEVEGIHGGERAQGVGERIMDVTNTPPTVTMGGEKASEKGAGRRPLYRQSSMDFLSSAKLDEDGNVSRLSNRFARAERLIPHTPKGKAGYHPYRRGARPGSPTGGNPDYFGLGHALNPSTPSSSTLNTTTYTTTSRTNTTSTNPTSWRTSSASSSSASSSGLSCGLVDPRVQRVRRAESYSYSAVGRGTLKRAPSFGAKSPAKAKSNAKTPASREKEVQSPGASSDEEEKARARGAKKARTTPARAAKSAAVVPPTPVQAPAKSKLRSAAKQLSVDTNTPTPTAASSIPKKPTAAAAVKKPTHPRANLQRNPSIFGAPLPALPLPASSSAPAPLTRPFLSTSTTTTSNSPRGSPMPLNTPSTPARTLRRVPRVPAELGRRIEFGGLLASPGGGERGMGLGSAFQLI
ncbi:hypothetical protein FIBSPDRAFT_950591 [Athelia psychrophila]|uniref:Uncharacterized protein n=1 Tax=Athelia psychrophila TaxID=1759441 RepID=A0A166NP02_9AGAM|nr:hypothetical protein FIBSPDRAFT_950591 [Fibularhizoctonia sp. CBS 109695]